jgi:hypothetical protein
VTEVDVSEHDEKAEERVEDLDVPESESEEVKGGASPQLSNDRLGFKQGLKFNKIQLGNKVNPGGGSFGDGSV